MCDLFFTSPNLKKRLFQKAILSLKFKFPNNNSKVLLAANLNFKLRIVFWNIFFWDLEIWKMNCTFWKKATFSISNAVCNLMISKCSFRVLQIPLLLKIIKNLYVLINNIKKIDKINLAIIFLFFKNWKFVKDEISFENAAG